MQEPIYIRTQEGEVVQGNKAFAKLIGRQTVGMLSRTRERRILGQHNHELFQKHMKAGNTSHHKNRDPTGGEAIGDAAVSGGSGEFEWLDVHVYAEGRRATENAEGRRPTNRRWLVKHTKIRLESGPASFVRLLDRGPARPAAAEQQQQQQP